MGKDEAALRVREPSRRKVEPSPVALADPVPPQTAEPQTEAPRPKRPRAADAKTPLLKQYLTLKEAHEDEILFFRCGDFYEMFYDDAETVSAALGLVLTTCGPGQEACPM